MKIEKLKLINFRNYREETITLDENINIIHGSNGHGKTNILEAISICSIAKSFRNAKDIEIKNRNSEFYKVELDFFAGLRKQKIEVRYREGKRDVFINGILIKKIGELIGNVPTVVFSPDDLKIIKGGPSERRKFIDIIISQIDRGYFYELQKYRKVIENRNALLREAAHREIDKLEMAAWNEGLVELGSSIMFKRNIYLGKIEKDANKYQRHISDNKESLQIGYNIQGQDIEESENKEKIKEWLVESLEKNFENEIRNRTTLIGPHRDDVKIYMNVQNLKKYGSQGQQRTAILSIKLAELELMKKEMSERPVLLLDDVMSELDSNRRYNLRKLIKDIQVIITTTENEVENIKKCKNIRIEEGRVIEP